ncbi:MAG TPA: hypothetical protein VGO11_11180 [Chthoniobacteraceae bacterium]|jgi:hypothetical protein|nr:hypothetical protein [Chthoniobacteraceae bacterium]
MKILNLLGPAAALLLLSSCTTYYKPDTSFPFDPIHEFTSKGTIDLINGQPSVEHVTFTNGYYADLNAWTDLAIEIAHRELSKRGMSIRKGAPKSLTLAIDSAKTDVGWVKIESRIVMRVKTSGGYSATFTGTDKAFMMGRPKNEMDAALMRVVVEMLSDPQIVGYLTK